MDDNQTCAIVSESLGVYLGHCMGLGFWSKLDPAGQDAAVTFASKPAAILHAATWEAQVLDLSFVPVTPDQGTWASVAACVAAGLPAWSPEMSASQ